MEIDGNDMVHPSNRQEIRDHPCGNCSPRRLALRLTRVWEIWHDSWSYQSQVLASALNEVDRTCDLVGRASLAGRDHDTQFHDIIIDLGAATLNDKDILLPNRAS